MWAFGAVVDFIIWLSIAMIWIAIAFLPAKIAARKGTASVPRSVGFDDDHHRPIGSQHQRLPGLHRQRRDHGSAGDTASS